MSDKADSLVSATEPTLEVNVKANTAAYLVYTKASDKQGYVTWRDVRACIAAYIAALPSSTKLTHYVFNRIRNGKVMAEDIAVRANDLDVLPPAVPASVKLCTFCGRPYSAPSGAPTHPQGCRDDHAVPASEPAIGQRDYMLVRVSDVAALTGLLPPPPVEVEGKRYRFVDPDPKRTMLAAAETVKVLTKNALPVAALSATKAIYDPATGKCSGDCDCELGQTCKAYLVYRSRVDSVAKK